MAPFSSRFITSAQRTWAFLLRTVVASTSQEALWSSSELECMQGGPAVARLGPLLFLPGCSGGFLKSQIQGDLGPGSLAIWEGVASCLVWAPSISPTLRRSGLRGGWRWFSFLLSRRRFGATGSRGRAGAFREEVSHRLRRLLILREAFSKALHSWSKQADWRDRNIEEGNFPVHRHDFVSSSCTSGKKGDERWLLWKWK